MFGEWSCIQLAICLLYPNCPGLELLGICRTWGIWQTDTLPHGVSNSACQIHGVWHCRRPDQELQWGGKIFLGDMALEGMKEKGVTPWAPEKLQRLRTSRNIRIRKWAKTGISLPTRRWILKGSPAGTADEAPVLTQRSSGYSFSIPWSSKLQLAPICIRERIWSLSCFSDLRKRLGPRLVSMSPPTHFPMSHSLVGMNIDFEVKHGLKFWLSLSSWETSDKLSHLSELQFSTSTKWVWVPT